MRGISRASLVLLFALFQLVFHGQTIWTIQNPKPPWDDYIAVHFIDEQLGWALGEEGYMIHTTDGAISWNVQAEVFTGYLRCVQFLNADVGWVAGDGIFKTTDGGETWDHQFGYGEVGFSSLYIVNNQTGYAGSNYGDIYKTTDGGAVWTKVYEGNTWGKKLFFWNEYLGWFMGRYNIQYTEDGGITWTESLSSALSYEDLNDFQFIDENTGWIVTEDDRIFSTSDAGMSWDTLIGPTYSGLEFVHFFDAMHGLVFTHNDCYITWDGGLTYEEAGGDYLNVQAVHFPDNTFGCTVGERQQYTLNEGNTWTRSDVGHTHEQFAVWMGPGERIVTGGTQGKLMLSDDNGYSWATLNSPVGSDIYDIFSLPGGRVWACGHAGKIFYSVNDGETWILATNSLNNSFQAISFGDELNGICVGQQAAICTTQDGGITWEFNTSTAYLNLNGVCHVDGQSAWICGDDGYLLKSEDGGITWTDYSVDTIDDLYSICFVSGNRGWTTSRGKIYSTIDGGENWFLEFDYVPGVWNDKIFSIEFKDSLNGWAVGEDGLTLHTEDAGTNWVVHDPVVDDDLFDIYFRSLDEIGVTGGSGTVLFTDQGTYLAPHVISLPSDTIVCSGEEVLLFCEATGDSLFYQWLSGGEELPGENNPTVLFDSISEFDGGLYSCRLSNGAGTLHSNEFMVSVKPKALVTGHPSHQIIYETDTVIFNQAVVGGLPLYFQWQKDGEDISGANQHVFAIYGVQLSDSGSYRCIVSNSCTADTTDGAWLTVLPASSVQEQSLKSPLFCYPNPTTNTLFVNFIGPVAQTELHVFSLQGVEQEVKKSQHLNGWKLGLENLDPGVYLIVVESSSEKFFGRIIKMKL